MLRIFPNAAEMNAFAAEKFIEIGNKAIKENGRFSVALAGGSTPKSLYRLLTSEKYVNRIEWKKVFFFFGDERNVLPEDEESNFKMAKENLLAPLNVSEQNVFRWQTEMQNAEQTSKNYAETLRAFFDLKENEFPRFNLILLGMGEDAHTASLFPFTEALDEKEKIAVSNCVEKLNANRLTLTFPAINNAENIIFLISGASKAEALKNVLEGARELKKFPSQAVDPVNGELFFLADNQAAQLLRV